MYRAWLGAARVPRPAMAGVEPCEIAELGGLPTQPVLEIPGQPEG